MPNNESTMKWKVDVAQLKAAMQDAKRSIQLANAEFKTATAGMDKWSKSTDGLEAKIKQLNQTLPAQKTILAELQKQYDLVAENQGETSKEAQNLQLQIEKQKAVIAKTESDIAKYNDQLGDLKTKQAEADSATGKLTKTIADQEEEMAKLKKAYADSVLQYGEGSEEAKELAKQIDDLSGELKDNKKKLSDAEKAADGLDKSMEDLAESTDDAGDEADKAAKGGFTVMKGALADLVAKGIEKAIEGLKNLAKYAGKAWQEWDEGADIIVAKTGATGKAAKDLETSYKNVSKQIVGSYDEIGTAVGEVNTRFGVTGDELEDLSVKFLQFAKLNGTDVNGSIDKVQASMAAWNMDAEDAGDMLDILNKVGQETGASVDGLADSLKTNAPALQEMGISVEDAATFLGNLDKNGVDASSTMGALKKALQNAAKEGKPMNQALSDMEEELKNATSETDAINKATKLFGKSAGASIAKAVRSGRLSFKDLGRSMEEFKGNVNDTFEATQDAPDKFALAIQGIKTDLAEMVSDLMQKYAPQIETIIGKGKDLIGGLFSVISGVIDFLIENGDTVIAILTGIGTALLVFNVVTMISKLVGLFQTFFAVIKAGEGIMAAFNVVMNANPIALIAAAVAGLIAALVVLWNKSEKFRQFWIDMWNKIKEVALAVWEAIKKVWETVANFFKTKVIEPVKNFFTGLWDGIKSAAKAAWDAVKKVWEVVSNWFKNKIIDPVKKFFTGMWDGLKNGAKAAWEGIKSVFGGIADWFKNIFSKAWNAVKKVFSTGGKIFEGIKDGIVKAFKAVVNAIIRGINKVIALPFNAINAVLRKIRDISILGITPFSWIKEFGVPQIPELRRGGVLKRGQVGLLEGDGAEAVVPLEHNRKWIAAVVKGMLDEMNVDGVKNAVGNKLAGMGGTTQTVTFNQVINSPKAVDRLTLYRQTNSLLFTAKVRMANV